LLHSNFDWGQDLLFYQRWLRQHPEAEPVGLAYSLPASLLDPADVGIPYAAVPSGPPKADARPVAEPDQTGPLPGWYAIFASELYARHGRYAYFHRFEPIERVGYTVFIYHITPDEANRVRRDLGLPEVSANT